MQLGEVLKEIKEVADDHSIPKRIREKLAKISKDLEDKNQDLAVKVTTAIYEIEEITNDVNIPMHVKTVMWDIVSGLEAVKKE
jgi:uncharacterized protein (UPF0147 family)